jgi:thiosulfate dehydrogenase
MSNSNDNDLKEHYNRVIRLSLNTLALTSVMTIGLLVMILNYDDIREFASKRAAEQAARDSAVATAVPVAVKEVAVSPYWTAPDIASIEDPALKEKISYGRDLIAHTSKYLGPKGTVMQITNGMNCQNCHLDAGTKVFGNNYGSVASLYPKFRARSGAIEDIYKRVNDCFERSLNGKALDTLGNEMQAIKAYIEFLGSNVEKGVKAEGSGFKDLAFLDRAADPEKGKLVYGAKCQSCHQANGEGTLLADGSEYSFPPLWGPKSYNDGAGLFRLSNFAKYVKYNMPLGVNHENTQLTDEEAWDVAAFVNSQPRPHKNVPKDWLDIAKKPIDHPFGPYADKFTEQQHKYGPFKPIQAERKKAEAKEKSKSKS